MVLKVASRDMKEVKICFSPSQQTATALGIILAVFSLVIAVTELISSLIWRWLNGNGCTAATWFSYLGHVTEHVRMEPNVVVGDVQMALQQDVGHQSTGDA